MIFHVEEDGYEHLSQYLTSVRAYFSTYEGHEEIVADIEARIAEIFASRLSPAKQVITLEDVQALVAQMGSVADFALLDEEEPQASAQGAYSPPGSGTGGAKRLYRDENNKMLGGVSSGIARYLGIDPSLIRLAFMALVFAGGFGLILYIICWIAIPANNMLPEASTRKLFRDPDNKMLGGVSSGLALYFGIDVAIVRILFLALIFAGGFSVIAYIVLWIVLPEAKTITEKVQMRGGLVTLSGIEESLKRGFNMKDANGQENTLARLILLPVRLIAQIINGLAKVLGPLVVALFTIIRVVVGILLIIISTGLMMTLISSLFIGLGWVNDDWLFRLDGMPASVFFQSVPDLGIFAGFLTGFIPAVFVFILAVILLTKRFFISPSLGWPLLALWLVSLFGLAATAIYMNRQFERTGEYVQEQSFPVAPYRTLFLDSNETGGNWSQRPRMELQSSTGEEVRVIKRFTAKGNNEETASENARMLDYKIVQRDSLIRFDEAFEYKEKALYRDQRLHLLVMLPEGKTYRISSDMARYLPSSAFNRDYDWDEISQNTFQIRNNQLECLTCPPPDTAQITPSALSGKEEVSFQPSWSSILDMADYGSYSRTYDLRDFSGVEINGAYHLRVRAGDAFRVTARGDQEEVEEVHIQVQGNRLIVGDPEQKNYAFKGDGPVLIDVQLPHLNQVTLKGAVKSEISGVNTDVFRLSQTGAAQSQLSVRSEEVYVTLAGASTTTFQGQTNLFKVNAEGACHLNAGDLTTKTAELYFAGASFADVHVSEKIEAHASGLSKITYRGNPSTVITDNSGPSSVTRR